MCSPRCAGQQGNDVDEDLRCVYYSPDDDDALHDTHAADRCSHVFVEDYDESCTPDLRCSESVHVESFHLQDGQLLQH
jgi:hypothetical protein